MATNNDEMRKYDDGTYEALALGGTGLAAQQASKRISKSKAAKETDAKLRKSSAKWKVSADDMLAARAHSNIVKAELKSLQDGDGTKTEISKAKREVKSAEKKITTIQERQEIKKLFDDNPDRSATRIQDDYKTEKARITGDKEYFKTEEGKSVKSKQDIRAAKLKDMPKATSRKIGLPVKRMKGLLGSAAASGVGYLGSKGLRDYYDETADDIRRRSTEQKGEVTKGAENKAQEYDDVAGYWDEMNEYAGYGTGVAATGLAGTQAANRINAMYNVGRYGPNADVGGMTNIESLQQFGKDISGAVKDPFKRAGAVSKRFNPLDTVDSQRAKDIYDYDVEQLDKAKKKRFTDPKMEEIEKYNEALEKRLTVEEAEKARFAGADRPEESGIKRTINNQMDSHRDQLKRAIQASRDALNASKVTGSASVLDLSVESDRLKSLEGKLNTLDKAKRSLAQELDFELESDKNVIKKYAKYIGSKAATSGEWTVADKGLFKTNSGVVAAEETFDKAKGVVDDVIDTGTEKGKGFVASAKQKATDAYKRAVGRPVTPEVGLSQTPDAPDVPASKQGIIGKTAKGVGKVGAKLGVPAGIIQAPTAGWGLAEIGHGMYDAPDKMQYAKETGEDIYEGIKQLPEDIMTTAADYKTMWDQEEYLPMVGKAAQDYLVPGVKTLGNIAMGVGEQMGMYDAPDYWDLESEGMDLVSERKAPTEPFHPSQMSPEAKALMTPGVQPKTSGITAAGVEGNELLDKRKQADANNKRLWAAQKDAAQRKYGGYNSAQEYADQFGVKAYDTSSGAYGNTPIYVSADGTSFSDVPSNVADKSSIDYDAVAGQAAEAARGQYVKFEKAAKEQAKQQARGPAFAGVPDEEYYAMAPADRAKAYTDYNRSIANKTKEKDLYERNLDVAKGFYGPERGAYIDTLANTMSQGQATPEQRVQTAVEINKGRIKEGWKVPFMDTPDPRSFGTHENVPGVVFENVPDELQSLSGAYDYLTGYKPK